MQQVLKQQIWTANESLQGIPFSEMGKFRYKQRNEYTQNLTLVYCLLAEVIILISF